MTTLREAAQQALEALEDLADCGAEAWSEQRPCVQIGREAITALRAALTEPDTCTWQQDGDSDSGVYGTSCGSYFSINDGTPEDNKMAWCCYCGKKLAQSLITEDEDD